MLSHCPDRDWMFGFDTRASSSRIDVVGFPRVVLCLTCVMYFFILSFCGAGSLRIGLLRVSYCNEK